MSLKDRDDGSRLISSLDSMQNRAQPASQKSGTHSNEPPQTEIPKIEIPQPVKREKNEPVEDDNMPEFQPAVRTMRDDRVVAVGGRPGKPNKLVLREIVDEKPKPRKK